MMRYKKLSINSSFISFYQNSHAGNCSARLTSLKSPFSKEKKISIWYLLINYWIVLGQHTLYWKASLPLNSQKILHPWLKRHDLNQSHPLIQHANLYRQIHPSRWCGHLLRQNERPKFPWRVDIQDQVQRVDLNKISELFGRVVVIRDQLDNQVTGSITELLDHDVNQENVINDTVLIGNEQDELVNHVQGQLDLPLSQILEEHKLIQHFLELFYPLI